MVDTRKTKFRALLLKAGRAVFAPHRAAMRAGSRRAEWGKAYPIKPMKKRPVSAAERRRILEETMPEKYKKKKKVKAPSKLTKQRKREAERLREAAGQ